MNTKSQRFFLPERSAGLAEDRREQEDQQPREGRHEAVPAGEVGQRALAGGVVLAERRDVRGEEVVRHEVERGEDEGQQHGVERLRRPVPERPRRDLLARIGRSEPASSKVRPIAPRAPVFAAGRRHGLAEGGLGFHAGQRRPFGERPVHRPGRRMPRRDDAVQAQAIGAAPPRGTPRNRRLTERTNVPIFSAWHGMMRTWRRARCRCGRRSRSACARRSLTASSPRVTTSPRSRCWSPGSGSAAPPPATRSASSPTKGSWSAAPARAPPCCPPRRASAQSPLQLRRGHALAGDAAGLRAARGHRGAHEPDDRRRTGPARGGAGHPRRAPPPRERLGDRLQRVVALSGARPARGRRRAAHLHRARCTRGSRSTSASV